MKNDVRKTEKDKFLKKGRQRINKKKEEQNQKW
jgi:hypothetical protein